MKQTFVSWLRLSQINLSHTSDVMGMWVEECDALFDEEYNETCWDNKNYKLKELCEVIHTTTAETLAVYRMDYYKNTPVITKNIYGCGQAYHVAANCDEELIEELCRTLTADAQIEGVLGKADIPEGIGIACRENATNRYIFIGNFSETEKTILFHVSDETAEKRYKDLLTDSEVTGAVILEAYGILILEEDI